MDHYLELSDTGRLVLGYAEEIFLLVGELEEVLYQLPKDYPKFFHVNVDDVLPKSIATVFCDLH
jgi:LysR family transcriptional activator of nhaA